MQQLSRRYAAVGISVGLEPRQELLTNTIAGALGPAGGVAGMAGGCREPLGRPLELPDSPGFEAGRSSLCRPLISSLSVHSVRMRGRVRSIPAGMKERSPPILPAWAMAATAASSASSPKPTRIHLAHLFDPVLAVHTSVVEPLPHQITAVYEAMLPRQPLRRVPAPLPLTDRQKGAMTQSRKRFSFWIF